MNAGQVVISGLGTAIAGVAEPAGLLGHRTPGGDPLAGWRGRGLRYKDRATRLAMCAGSAALTDAGLLRDGELTTAADEVGVVVSSNLGNVDTVCETVELIAEQTYEATSPMLLPNTASNVIASWVAIANGPRGANLTLCNGATSGLDAVHWARLLVAAGRVRQVLVVGTEPDTAPARQIADCPALFDGAAALVVEPAATAVERGARPFAVLGGYTRRAGLAEAIESVRATSDGEPELWCPPGIETAGGPRTARCDLSARFGECSGALGVLQCVAGAVWLSGAHGPVLATTADADAAAALLLIRPQSTAPGTRPAREPSEEPT
ncbi:beta-ketoacyl synthase N-terminal-like domain-containing protein [Amycolatopsis sp. YIM 10]|uniref:beta-ketoacyl synthase N-terminal-like domain-containing protein n=1 Tax=Amycolatopsis sp. YIM 10 TaxID=2653857 RepID=UPI00128FD557|nr:beta-ketoacyl synthase N-terminal-like domain-containing protein [Amycolatopsis sp. YIM 10]QFU90549.1 3-oxoacyl-[acyl-carrier-protein] synthase 2 [Amycolatopsis sp. YIM 10]